jgi:RNA polymerase sigma factor (sigma-70 family)
MTAEPQLLEAARAGDEKAFALLLGPYQAQLCSHCYRMLGSIQDAEDALQDTMLRAWRGLAGFESRSSLRSWLYRIATNASLRIIEKRPKRILPIDYAPAADPHLAFGQPLTDSIWLQPYPDAQLGVEASMLGPGRTLRAGLRCPEPDQHQPQRAPPVHGPQARPGPRQHRPGRRVAAGLQAALRRAFGHLDGAVRDVLAELVRDLALGELAHAD